jgi:hypothetical protein
LWVFKLYAPLPGLFVPVYGHRLTQVVPVVRIFKQLVFFYSGITCGKGTIAPQGVPMAGFWPMRKTQMGENRLIRAATRPVNYWGESHLSSSGPAG